MKRSLIALICILLTSYCIAQTNTFPPNGNVGIGTLNPSHRLEIDGDVKLVQKNQGYLMQYASLSETLGGASTILGNNVKSGATYNSVKRFYNPTDPGSFISLNYYHGITFHTNVVSALDTDFVATNNEVMRIAHNGNIGIGTSSPSEKLAVNGNIRAKEIKVENANWPDYVFDKGYKLPSLSETEKHIKEMGHLPGIPSASEVAAKGVDLGEMNRKLLEKIEELTLHLIEMNKAKLKQEEINKVLQAQITELNSKLK